MKKLFIASCLLVFSLLSVNAQNVFLIKSDTVQGAETVDFTTNELTRTNDLIAIQAECDQLAGSATTDSIVGITSITGNLYASMYGQSKEGVLFFPSQSVVIADNATMVIDIVNIPNNYYGFRAVGAVGDTTIINVYGITKR